VFPRIVTPDLGHGPPDSEFEEADAEAIYIEGEGIRGVVLIVALVVWVVV
jgi:hypothetical protein